MKKLFLVVSATFLCFISSAQSVPMRALVSCGGNGRVAYSIGQTFNQHAPAASVPLLAEGIQQGYATLAHDTLLLLVEEMADYTPGDNVILGYTPEGYDEERHRQVYEMICANDFDSTMTESGQPTCSVTLDEPQILPAGSVAPSGPVALALDRSNPYDYPVGDTTEAVWTATVAGQSKECRPKVMIHFYDCTAHHPSVTDYDGHSYPVINLGYYCWTGKNMRATHYDNGTDVPNVRTFPAEYSQGITDMAGTFGHLYTWDAATNYNIVGTRMQGVCPTGWHVPNETEAEYLLAHFESTALMSHDAEVHWLPTDGTDEHGFSFLPAGFYSALSSMYEGLYVRGYFWTTETDGSTIAHACEFGDACGTFEVIPGDRSNAYSVRCVMNY